MLALSRGEAALNSRIRLPSTVLVFDSVSDGTTTPNKFAVPPRRIRLNCGGIIPACALGHAGTDGNGEGRTVPVEFNGDTQ